MHMPTLASVHTPARAPSAGPVYRLRSHSETMRNACGPQAQTCRHSVVTFVPLGRYIVWTDSSVRGPFVPGYVREPWHVLLTAYLKGTVKLVGGTISCAGLKTSDEPGWVQSPHVQASPQY